MMVPESLMENLAEDLLEIKEKGGGMMGNSLKIIGYLSYAQEKDFLTILKQMENECVSEIPKVKK